MNSEAVDPAEIRKILSVFKFSVFPIFVIKS